MRRIAFRWLALAGVLTPTPAIAAVPNSFILNEANAVTGDKWLDDQNRNRNDLTLGRVQGNGQNWLEFLVVQGDEKPGGGFKNTLDLRNWTIEWSYNKMDVADPNKYGQGTIKFTNDPLWAAVPVGTLLTISEWKEAWYHNAGNDPAGFGGLQRDGGIGGLGTPKGDPYQAGFHTLVDLATDTRWNPRANGGGAAGDWRLHVWAGEQNPDLSYKFFEYDGTIVDGNPSAPIDIGTEAGGLFVVNNDNWQWTIKDASNVSIQGPFGEHLSNGNWSVNSQEIFRLENFATNATQARYLGVVMNDYQDGSSSAFAVANTWSGGSFTQDLSQLRNWIEDGDVDLDGAVTGGDFLAWQRGYGTASPAASLTQGDLNGDLAVNAADLGLWKTHFGAVAVPVGTTVPECGAALLGSISAVGCFIPRKRHRT